MSSITPSQVDWPETIDGVMDAVRSAVIKDSFHSLSITKGKPIVFKHYAPTKEFIDAAIDEVDKEGLTPYKIAINTSMEEFLITEQGIADLSSPSVMFWAIYFIEVKGFTPTHILISESSKIWRWLRIGSRQGEKLTKLLGLTIIRDKNIPDTVALITGSKDRGATLSEISFVLKVNVGENYA